MRTFSAILVTRKTYKFLVVCAFDNIHLSNLQNPHASVLSTEDDTIVLQSWTTNEMYCGIRIVSNTMSLRQPFTAGSDIQNVHSPLFVLSLDRSPLL